MFSQKTKCFKTSSLFIDFLWNDILPFSSQLSLTKQHDSNQVVLFKIFSEMIFCDSVINFLWKNNLAERKYSFFRSTLILYSKMTFCYSFLNFLWKDNMVQSKKSFSKFSLTWQFTSQFSLFAEKRTLFKPSSLFLIFLENDILLYSSQFSRKRQHGSNQVVFFLIVSKMSLSCSVLHFFFKDNMVETK